MPRIIVFKLRLKVNGGNNPPLKKCNNGFWWGRFK
jgi:hypothetical protein